jgi:hypothetical protein
LVTAHQPHRKCFFFFVFVSLVWYMCGSINCSLHSYGKFISIFFKNFFEKKIIILIHGEKIKSLTIQLMKIKSNIMSHLPLSFYSGIQTTRAHLKSYPICYPPRFFESGKLEHLNHLQKKTQLPPPDRATCSIIIISYIQSGDSKSQCMSTKLIVANLDKECAAQFTSTLI